MKLVIALLFAAGLLVVAGSALAQSPGAPIGPPCQTAFDIVEGTVEGPPGEHLGPLPTPCPVFTGYVVLLESPDPALQQDLRNWSDVVAFTTGGPMPPGSGTDHYFFISDSPDPATGIENGMTPADLAVAGLTQADILSNPTTVYIVEGLNPANPDVNDYIAANGAVLIHYTIHSDRPEGPTPNRKASWGRLKMLYR